MSHTNHGSFITNTLFPVGGFMAARNLLVLMTVLTLTSPAYALDKAYQCKNDKGKITLQDKPCPNGSDQKEIELTVFNNENSYDGLREHELTALERLHELDLIFEQYNLERRNILTFESARSRHAQEMEELRHKHAIEMFDKSYQHFFVYGASNGPYGGAFPFAYSPGGFGCNGGMGGFGATGGNATTGGTGGAGALSGSSFGNTGAFGGSAFGGFGAVGGSTFGGGMGNLGGPGAVGGAGGTGCIW